MPRPSELTSLADETLAEVPRRLLAALAVGGLAISGYLAALAIATARLPVGCAPGGGCAAVLGSRWAGTWGVPVAVPAVLVWGVALVAALAGSRRVLAPLGLLVGLAALWFIGVQVVAVGAICPWCMADHAVGLLFAGVVLARLGWSFRPALAAAAALSVLVVGQVAVPYRPGTAGRLAGGADAGGRSVEVAGRRYDASSTPSWGPADGRETLLLFADYACPHCRATHGFLKELLAADPTRYLVLVAPVPMDHDCNRTLASTEPRFEHSCELAHLAYATWRCDPAAFARLDDWLFEPEEPRDPAAARAEAERLVGADRLAAALAAFDLAGAVGRNVDAFEALGARRLPVIVRTTGRSIEGEPTGRGELDTLLRDAADERSAASGASITGAS